MHSGICSQAFVIATRSSASDGFGENFRREVAQASSLQIRRPSKLEACATFSSMRLREMTGAAKNKCARALVDASAGVGVGLEVGVADGVRVAVGLGVGRGVGEEVRR